MELANAVDRLSALAHTGRLSAFRLLVQAGTDGLAAGEIARRLEIAPGSLTANLNILSQAGLIQSRRDGRSIIYTARYDAMRDLLSFLLEDCCGGNPDICAPLSDIFTRAACCAADTAEALTASDG